MPLVQIAREDLVLRAENLYALSLAGVQSPSTELLTITDIESFSPLPTLTYFLVDQNRLPSQYPGSVVGIIDHHQDEGLYQDTAKIRNIKPCGSCSSLVATSLPAEIPTDVATLLLTAVIIDTNGLKQGGKATSEDLEAAAKLVSLTSPSISPDNLHGQSFIKDLNKELQTRKEDLSHLSGWDLLRRDYKEYSYQLHWAKGAPTIKVGLSTVPVALKEWGKKGQLETHSVKWMEHRRLTVLGVLTTFNSKKKAKGKKKGEHKRETAWIILPTGDLDIHSLAKRLFAGLEGSQELDNHPHKKFKLEKGENLPKGAKGRVYKQGNASATRKAVAPLVKTILEGSTNNEAPAQAKPPEVAEAKPSTPEVEASGSGQPARL